jgi:hypothetical protein
MNKSLETMQEVETFYPQNIAEWRDWLENIITLISLFGLYFIKNHLENHYYLV